ncbi:MAG: L-histidine N(alpha)-methyltransferase [Bradyrhizobium sp.]|nr:L-histidine N(alpha)-methyltransferase [Bradyrhizobium sp.]
MTAAFNRNLLARINRELGGDFPLDRFRHEARWNEAESAVEMHLVSRDARVVTIDNRRFAFEAGECSRKFEQRTFLAIAERNGWRLGRIWQDRDRRFSLFGLDAAG